MSLLNRCDCCGAKILVDGNFNTGSGVPGGQQLARYWGGFLQEMCDAIGLGWQVVFYPDVAGPDFDHDDFIGIHYILPIVEPGSATGIYDWDPPNGHPRRVVIHGDAYGDSDAPYDYETACKDAIAALGVSKGYAVRIGADANDGEDWTVDSIPLTTGVTGDIVSDSCSEVVNGTRIARAPTVSTRTMAHDSFMSVSTGKTVSWVLAGTPSWLVNDAANNQLLVNMHTVSVA